MDYSDRRVEPRIRAMIRARLRDASEERDACILDISTRGILATTAVPPLRGEFVELMIGQHILVGQVKWSSSHRFGLALQHRVSVAALLSGDTDTISLKKIASAQKSGSSVAEALRTNSGTVGNALQYAIMVAVGLGGAILLADVAGDGLESLDVAKEAMAHR